MRLKTFRAPDLATALSRARREMGPNALVLATNEIRGRLGLPSVEITVATDSERRHRSPEVARLSREVNPGQGYPTAAGKPPASPSVKRTAANGSSEKPNPAKRAADEPDGMLKTAAEGLVRAGVAPDLAMRFARIAADTLLESGPESVGVAVGRAMDSVLPITEDPLRSRVLFVVGPPGAGKTTTAAKLAWRRRERSDAPVLLAEADTERPGAVIQAMRLSLPGGVPVLPIRKPADLVRARGEADAIVVDTAGIGESDDARLRWLLALCRSVPDADVALLLPNGLHHEEAARVLRRFERLRPTCVAFSKVDDGCRPGELVTAVAASGLPLAFVTNGHEVPRDLETVSARGLTAMLLRAGLGDRLRAEASR